MAVWWFGVEEMVDYSVFPCGGDTGEQAVRKQAQTARQAQQSGLSGKRHRD